MGVDRDETALPHAGSAGVQAAWRVGARAQLGQLLSGANIVGNGAGGFDKCRAVGPLNRAAQPANVNRARELTAAQIYAQKPTVPLGKASIAGRFS